VIVIRPCFLAFPDMAAFMAGNPAEGGRTGALSAHLCRTEGLRPRIRCPATVDMPVSRHSFAADDAFATEPTIGRLEALYGTQIPLRDAALYRQHPCASPISNAAARHRLGWTPTTRWTAAAINA
jgi:hypothetical protein